MPSTSSAQSRTPSDGNMRFAELNAEFSGLRNSLRAFVGEDALDEIIVQPPSREDEASFLRLVAWSYVFAFEAGRVSIPYFLKLPSRTDRSQNDPHESRSLIHALRTWSFHNLGFSDERNIKMTRRVHQWFIQNGGASPPNSSEGWQRCFERLCIEVGTIVAHCRGAVELVLTGSEDGGDVIADIKRQLDRNWPAYRFDQLVGDAAARIGQKLDVPKFRQSRLGKWREFLQTIPSDDDPQILLVRLIERDVLDHFESVLPIDGRDVMDALGLATGREVGTALRRARWFFDSGIREPKQLLNRLKLEEVSPSEFSFEARAAKLRKRTINRVHTPSEELQREGREER